MDPSRGPGRRVTPDSYHWPMALAAYLRMYVPIDPLDAVLEHVTERVTPRSVMTDGGYGIWRESSRDDAFVIKHDGRRYVCPRHPRLRMLESLVAFRNAYAGPTASVLVSETAAESAVQELDRIHARSPGVKSHILTSPFFVPLRWFAAFDPDVRELIETDEGLSIRYRSNLEDALIRVRRSIDVLEEAGFEDVVVDQVRDLVSWMEAFSSPAVLELDYGRVIELFSDGDLVLDETAAEVAASLDALERGDYEAAGEHYASAASRWAHAQSLGYAN